MMMAAACLQFVDMYGNLPLSFLKAIKTMSKNLRRYFAEELKTQIDYTDMEVEGLKATAQERSQHCVHCSA